jgi:hypothetical protein
MTTAYKKQFKWRGFISTVTAVAFLGVCLTGVTLFIVPPGRIANWTGWTWWGLTKHQWGGLHMWFSLLFVVAALIHVYFNWRVLLSYFRHALTKRFALRAEWVMSLVLCGLLAFGTIAGIRPFSDLLDWHEAIKRSWDTSQRQGPVAHAELLTLQELADQVDSIDIGTMLSHLKAKGIQVDSADVELSELADQTGMTPRELYQIALGGQTQGLRSGQTGDHGRGMGIGRMTLQQYCDQVGLEVDVAVQKLEAARIQASARMILRDIADSNQKHPSEIRKLLE